MKGKAANCAHCNWMVLIGTRRTMFRCRQVNIRSAFCCAPLRSGAGMMFIKFNRSIHLQNHSRQRVCFYVTNIILVLDAFTRARSSCVEPRGARLLDRQEENESACHRVHREKCSVQKQRAAHLRARYDNASTVWSAFCPARPVSGVCVCVCVYVCEYIREYSLAFRLVYRVYVFHSFVKQWQNFISIRP